MKKEVSCFTEISTENNVAEITKELEISDFKKEIEKHITTGKEKRNARAAACHTICDLQTSFANMSESSAPSTLSLSAISVFISGSSASSIFFSSFWPMSGLFASFASFPFSASAVSISGLFAFSMPAILLFGFPLLNPCLVCLCILCLCLVCLSSLY